MIRFRYYKRKKQFKVQFDRLITALKSSKIDFECSINNIKGHNYIEFKVNDPIQNDTFWYVINLWSKR
jgi:hypothetical protein